MTFKNHVVPFFSIIQSFEQSTMTFLCPTCGKLFLAKKSFVSISNFTVSRYSHAKFVMKHVLELKKFSNHLRIHQTFECSICNSTVKLNIKGSHIKTCSKQKGKRYSCPECPRVSPLSSPRVVNSVSLSIN